MASYTVAENGIFSSVVYMYVSAAADRYIKRHAGAASSRTECMQYNVRGKHVLVVPKSNGACAVQCHVEANIVAVHAGSAHRGRTAG